VEALDAGDTIANLKNATDFFTRVLGRELSDVFFDCPADVIR
jgi:hypothetical protein